MRSLSPSNISLAIAANCLLMTGIVDAAITRSMAIAAPSDQIIAQVNLIPVNSCSQLTNRPYVVIADRPANLLPQLPEFLAIAAVPCSYLNGSMTFFGGFDNARSSTFRASQLRELGLGAIVHSFTAKVNDIPANFQAAAVLVEPNNDPNIVIQQVRSLTGKGAVLATFNNRSVIVAAPLSSQQNANAIASLLRNRGIAAQVIGATLISAPSEATSSIPTTSIPTTSVPISTPNPQTARQLPNQTSRQIIYRVLVPNTNANTLKQLRALAPDAFVTIFRGQSYIQVRTYNNRSNAHRERDRLNARFPNTILLQD